MAVNNLIKRLQNIMRQDAGISGDAQRIEQMVWMFFLKVYDAQEEVWEYKAYKEKRDFESIIPDLLDGGIGLLIMPMVMLLRVISCWSLSILCYSQC